MISFLNTAVLFGLLGVGLPLLIHLFARHKVQRVLFSSTKFLKQIQSQKMRRMKIRQLLLLLLRSLAIFFLVMAFARPTIRTRGVLGKGRARSSVALVVDRSISMGRDQLFQKAKERAASVFDLLHPEDQISLIWTVSEGKERPSFIYYSNVLKQELLKEEVSWERGNPLKSVEEAITLLSSSHNINRELYVISDFQATNFSDLFKSDLVKKWKGKLFILPVIGKVGNIALSAGGVENQILQQGIPLRVFADVKNYGEERVTGLLVRLFLENEAVAQKVVDIEPHQIERVSFRVMPHVKGWIWGSIQFETDNFYQDNKWFFTCYIPEQIKVLLVGKNRKDVQPIQLALNPQNERGGIYNIKQMFYGSDWINQINKTDVICFSNYPSFTPKETDRLKQFVENGGGVFFLMGDNVDLRNVSEYFCNPLLGVSLGNVVSSGIGKEGYLTFGSVDFNHPIFEGVFEKGKKNVRSPHFFRVVEIVGRIPHKIILLRDEKPFLVEKNTGKGKVFLSTSGVGERWSDLPFSTIFVPVITRSVIYLSNSLPMDTKNITVGNQIILSRGVEDVNAKYHVEEPTGENIFLLPEVKGGEMLLTLPRTEIPGIYRFYSGKLFIGMRVVNIDTRESDFRSITKKEIEKNFSKGQVKVVEEDESLKPVVSRARWGRELWREMVLLALVVLIVEMIIAKEWKKL